jgi:hypothetical protein
MKAATEEINMMFNNIFSIENETYAKDLEMRKKFLKSEEIFYFVWNKIEDLENLEGESRETIMSLPNKNIKLMLQGHQLFSQDKPCIQVFKEDKPYFARHSLDNMIGKGGEKSLTATSYEGQEYKGYVGIILGETGL